MLDAADPHIANPPSVDELTQACFAHTEELARLLKRESFGHRHCPLRRVAAECLLCRWLVGECLSGHLSEMLAGVKAS